MAILEAADLTKDLEGTYYSPKMQWWCAHADLVDDAGNETALYFWPALGSLDEAWICSLHTKDEMLDLTQLYQPLGTFKTSRSGSTSNSATSTSAGPFRTTRSTSRASPTASRSRCRSR